MDREGRNWSKEEIPGSGRSLHGCILTYSDRLERDNILQLWVLNSGDLNLCVRIPPLRVLQWVRQQFIRAKNQEASKRNNKQLHHPDSDAKRIIGVSRD